LECKNWAEMSVADTIFGQWGIAVADNVYIRNGRGSNIGAQTFKVRRPTNLLISTLGFPWEVCKKKLLFAVSQYRQISILI